MNATHQGLLVLLGPAVFTLLAAFSHLRSARAAWGVRCALLLSALGVVIYGVLNGGTQLPSTEWLLIPGQSPAIQLGWYANSSARLLVAAVAVLTLVTLVALPDSVSRADTSLLLIASAATHVVLVGEHLLVRLAAAEILLLMVLLLVVSVTTKIQRLVLVQRVAAGLLLLVSLISGGQRSLVEMLGAGSVDFWVPALVIAAVMALGGAFPFHRGLLALQSCAPVQRAHLSSLLLLAGGGLLLRLTSDPMVTDWWSTRAMWFAIPAALTGLMSLASTDLRRAQMWSWSSQLGFAILVTLHFGTDTVVGVWICLALVRPAAGLAADTVSTALGEDARAPRWGGLASALPAACWMSVIAAVCVAGLPPLGLFALNAQFLAPLVPTSHLFALTAGLPAILILPAIRVGFWPFFGPPRHRVLAQCEQTALRPLVVAVVIGSAVVGALVPLALMLESAAVPPMPALATAAAVVIALGLITQLIGRQRGQDESAPVPGLVRQYVGDGAYLPRASATWMPTVVRHLMWMIEGLALLPGAVAQMLRATGWGVTWLESRPLWWGCLTVIGIALAILGGRQ